MDCIGETHNKKVDVEKVEIIKELRKDDDVYIYTVD